MRRVVKGNRRPGSMLPDQVDNGFEHLQLFLGVPDPATDNNAVPRPGLESCGNASLDVVATVETHQAGFRMEAVIGESGHADLDRVRYRLRVPWAGHPIGVETNDEDMKRITH